jgi:hypothetical protein
MSVDWRILLRRCPWRCFRRYGEGRRVERPQPPQSEHPLEQARKLGIAGHGGHLVAPEIDELLCQLIQVGGLGHGR